MAKKTSALMPPTAMPAGDPEDGSDKDYKANRAYDTLSEAAGHMADPGMMKRVKKIAGRKHKAVTGLHKGLLGMDKEDESDGGSDEGTEGGEKAAPLTSIKQLRDLANKKALSKKY